VTFFSARPFRPAGSSSPGGVGRKTNFPLKIAFTKLEKLSESGFLWLNSQFSFRLVVN
jgi:hypothetical protein